MLLSQCTRPGRTPNAGWLATALGSSTPMYPVATAQTHENARQHQRLASPLGKRSHACPTRIQHRTATQPPPPLPLPPSPKWLSHRSRQCRYKTFLSLHKSHPNTALQPPCDIELVRRAHMCMPASQRGFPDPPPPPPPPASPGTSPAWRRSASNGSHRRPASDGRPLTARSWVADHGEHDEATRAAFSNAGWELFRSGAMFRGTPRRLTPRQREECQPGAAPGRQHLRCALCATQNTSRTACKLMHSRRRATCALCPCPCA